MTDFPAHTARIINRLGRPVTVTPSGQPARVVNAIFTTTQDIAFGLVDGSKPALRMTTADAAGLEGGDAIAVGTDAYTVAHLVSDRDAGDVLVQLESA